MEYITTFFAIGKPIFEVIAIFLISFELFIKYSEYKLFGKVKKGEKRWVI